MAADAPVVEGPVGAATEAPVVEAAVGVAADAPVVEAAVETATEAPEVEPARVTAVEPVISAYVQYREEEADVNALVESVKAAFAAEHAGETPAEIRLYIKPEERAAYYVVNGVFNGCVKY